jgi:dephospho-CoA kinase
MKVIGLTGGIGTGKSAAAQILQELGAEVIDADKVAHELYAPGTSGWEAVVGAFGREILDPQGRIDRKRLAAIVFKDRQARERLERIMHPLVTEEIRRRIDALRTRGTSHVVVEAALLIEAGWHSLVDEVWLLTAPPEVVHHRLKELRGMEPGDIAARQSAQLTDEARRVFAHRVIENAGTLSELREQLAAALASDC